MLKPGGRLYLMDVVFSFELNVYQSTIADWIDQHSRHVDSGALIHIKKEYSTMAWVMEGMLERAGFEIENADYRDGFLAGYLCRKPAS